MFSKIFIKRLTRLMFCALDGDGGTPTTGGGGAGAGDGGSATSGGGNAGVPSAQPGAQGGSPSSGQGGTNGGQGGSPTIDWNTAPQSLRDEYNRVKTEHEKWSKLGDHAVASTHVQTMQGFINEAYTLGEKFGYTDEQIHASLQKNFLGTINFLKGKMSQGGGQGGHEGGQPNGGAGQKTIEQQIEEALAQRLEPINKDLQQRQIQAANTRFDGEANRLMQEAYKEDFGGMPGEFKNLLLDAASEIFKYDQQGSQSLFKDGKVAGVQKAFNEAKTIIEGAFIKWQQWQTSKGSRGGGQPGNAGNGGGNGNGNGGNGGNGGKPMSGADFLDSIIQGDDNGFNELSRRRGR